MAWQLQNGGSRTTGRRTGRRPSARAAARGAAVLLAALLAAAAAADPEVGAVRLGDLARQERLTWTQGWGRLGIDSSAVPPDGRPPLPLRIADRTYAYGLGHHANGEIRVPLGGSDVRFRAEAGVQWQGGGRGSTVLQVWVDDELRFASGARGDSDAPLAVDIPTAGGRVLRLVAADHGDGIGCDMATWAEARLLQDPDLPRFGTPVWLTAAEEAAPVTDASCGFSVAGDEGGPQAAFLEPPGEVLVSLPAGAFARLRMPLRSAVPVRLLAEAGLEQGEAVEAAIAVGPASARRGLPRGRAVELDLDAAAVPDGATLDLTVRASGGAAVVRWSRVRVATASGLLLSVPLVPPPSPPPPSGPPSGPALHGAIEAALVDWDWRLQDGIGHPSHPVSWRDAALRVLQRGQALAARLPRPGRGEDFAAAGERLAEAGAALDRDPDAGAAAWRDLWSRVHVWRRGLLLHAAWPDGAPPLAFVKQVPSMFSHQLTQYYGSCARPGGGLFVLDEPGRSMRCRQLGGDLLPTGSVQHVDVSFDGTRLLFAFCAAASVPPSRESHLDRFYQVHEIGADGGGHRLLTQGPYDQFCPRYLPDGGIVFLSTRRGGFHRCGRGPCPVYTLTRAAPDGSQVRTISFHETHEWDPSVLADGRIVYTRWDYVDRNAVYYQQLWSVRPDGSDARILYGNHTLNPVGVWEARAVPESRLLMATAAAHHAMTAGSIILLDPGAGVDGLVPITRLTPDVRFPESEWAVAPSNWRGSAGVDEVPQTPAEEQRWPGHCYRSPYPLSATLFLAAYSFSPLLGEPVACTPNMFGLYVVDDLGNKELLYRDPNLASLWPVPLAARRPPPQVASVLTETVAADGDGSAEPGRSERGEGCFLLANVRHAYPALPADERIARLRVLQVLPKTTPHANQPPVGLANASPGKQVLGTVPVEADGSAFFRVPAGIPVLFQALDARGQAVQTMRTLTYVQSGETAGCLGCHEPRLTAPPAAPLPMAARRPPSVLEPAPPGANPLSFPILVQPVLDRHCLRCHSGPQPKGGIALTAEPEGHYTRAYVALAGRVRFSAWGGGDFRRANSEPLTQPDFFGARASALTRQLRDGHHGVELDAAEWERLVTWMDANALFYGTFNPQEQARQRRGEAIDGPDLE